MKMYFVDRYKISQVVVIMHRNFKAKTVI
jgi:hypothetical protein